MKKVRETGAYISCSVSGENYKAFVPAPLPPEPPLDMSHLSKLLADASAALARLGD